MQLSIFDLLETNKDNANFSLQKIDKKEVLIFKSFKRTQKYLNLEITICKVKSGYFYLLHLGFKTGDYRGLAWGISEEETVFVDFSNCLINASEYLKRFFSEVITDFSSNEAQKKESELAIDWLNNLSFENRKES